MKVQWLEAFLKVAEKSSFSVAADELYISQSSLSKYIKSLEEELGTTLFTRSARSVQLTDAGYVLSEHASKMVADYHSLCAAMHPFSRTGTQDIKIYSVPIVHLYDFADIFIDIAEKEPKLTFQVLEVSCSDAIRAAKRNPGTVSIIRDISILQEFDPKSYVSYPFIPEKLVAIFHESHSFAGKDSVTLRECLKEPLVLLNNGFPEYQAVYNGIGISLEHQERLTLCASVATLKYYMEKNRGVAFISETMAKQLCAGSSICYRPISDAPSFSLSIVMKKDSITRDMQHLVNQILLRAPGIKASGTEDSSMNSVLE